MHVRSLFLHQFRNYRSASFEFNSSLNLICGPNAQGKTSLLEALHYGMAGRSFRTTRQQELIHLGTSSFHLEIIFCKHDVDQKLQLYSDGKTRKLTHNSTVLPSASNLLGLIPGVIMTPDDVNLVKGSPPLRRQFLDMQIAQIDPLYVHYLTRYVKAMRHRNQLLKEKKIVAIETWEHEMAQASSYLVMRRREVVKELQIHSQKFYSYLTSQNDCLALEYQSSASHCQNEQEIKQFYIQQHQKNRFREMMLGLTLSGPHKDDLWIGIGGKDVRYFASEGEQRSCIVALYMGSWKRMKEASEVYPLFMIDDVGISLDKTRRERLVEQLANLGQIFLTTTDSQLIHSFQGSKNLISLP